MDNASMAQALERTARAFTRKPGLAVQDDTPARATLVGGARTRIEAPDGTLLHTDLDAGMGGDGQGVSPGWLMRAGLASCLATAVALRAARQGIALQRLEVRAGSRSDARGLLGCGADVPPSPLHVSLVVTLGAEGVDAAALRELVAWADAHSPVSEALRRALDVRLQVEVGAG